MTRPTPEEIADWISRRLAKIALERIDPLRSLSDRDIETCIDHRVRDLCARGAWIEEIDIDNCGNYRGISFSCESPAFVITMTIRRPMIAAAQQETADKMSEIRQT